MVVLVVEDEAIIAFCSAAMLEAAGYAVLGPAHTSAEALNWHAASGSTSR